MIPPLYAAPTAAAHEAAKPKDAADAAKQFEAMLIAQMLQTAREESSDDDSSSSTMLDLADQQFAKMISERGGLGLGSLINKSL